MKKSATYRSAKHDAVRAQINQLLMSKRRASGRHFDKRLRKMDRIVQLLQL